ncbi:caspase family protein [Micromonospora echinospora]
MARLSDPVRSRAVLIGVSAYEHLSHLPAVAANVEALATLLGDPSVWGLPESNCTVLRDPCSGLEVLDAIHGAARAARDTLVVYFAGHGLLDADSHLYLGLRGASHERLHHAVRFDEVRREVTASRCRAKVVILDCCYSGRAMAGYMAARPQFTQPPVVDGAYLMTATAETVLAVAPPGAEFTAFTGALVETLRDGVPAGPDPLDMETVFGRIEELLRARDLPQPQSRSRNEGHRTAIARNRAPTAVPVSAVEPAPARGRRWAMVGAVVSVLVLGGLLASQQSGLRSSDADERRGPPTSAAASPTTSGASPTGASTGASQAGSVPSSGPARADPDLREQLTVGVGSTGETSDGTVQIGVSNVNQDGIGFFVATTAVSCTVDGSDVGDTVVLLELSGGWIRILVLRTILPTVDALHSDFDIPVVFSVSRGTGTRPQGGPCR